MVEASCKFNKCFIATFAYCLDNGSYSLSKFIKLRSITECLSRSDSTPLLLSNQTFPTHLCQVKFGRIQGIYICFSACPANQGKTNLQSLCNHGRFASNE